jgi:protein arginine kinase
VIESLLNHSSRWLRSDWNVDDIVVCNEVKMSRNLANTDFAANASSEDRKRVKLHFNELYDELGSYRLYDMADVGVVERRVMVENRMTSADFQVNKPFSCVFYGEVSDNSICINDCDHVRIRTVGEDPWQAIEKAQAEETLMEHAGFKFSFKTGFGFLTSHYDECGSGMRLSTVVRLPALNLKGMLIPVMLRATTAGVKAGRAFGDNGRYFCDMVQFSIDPPSIAHISQCVESLNSVVSMAADHERECRKTIPECEAAVNAIGMSWGIATNMASAGFEMAGSAISLSVLAVKTGLAKIPFPEVFVNNLRDATVSVMSGHLQAHGAVKADEDRKRVETLRTIFRRKPEFCLK